MKIDFKKLIAEYNATNNTRLTQSAIAREMVTAGVLRTFRSAVTMMQYHSSGKAKSVDYEMLLFLEQRFGKTFDQIVEREQKRKEIISEKLNQL